MGKGSSRVGGMVDGMGTRFRIGVGLQVLALLVYLGAAVVLTVTGLWSREIPDSWGASLCAAIVVPYVAGLVLVLREG